MGLNVLLFIVFQIAVEPWRRRRLVKGFEEKVKEALEKEGGIGVSSAAGVVAAGDGTERAHHSVEYQAQTEVADAPTLADVESAIEAVTDAEIAQATVEEVGQTASTPMKELPTDQPAVAEPVSNFAYCKTAFLEIFSEKKVLTVTQKKLTTVALEGAAGGAALTWVLLVLLRSK